MTDLRTVSSAVALAVAQAAQAEGVAREPLHDPIQRVYDAMWRPEYRRSKFWTPDRNRSKPPHPMVTDAKAIAAGAGRTPSATRFRSGTQIRHPRRPVRRHLGQTGAVHPAASSPIRAAVHDGAAVSAVTIGSRPPRPTRELRGSFPSPSETLTEARGGFTVCPA